MERLILHGSDCDDTNASINPSAEEGPADGTDQNCNGFEICYEDIDGDGFGASEIESPDFLCAAAGLSLNDLDCDDDDASRSPGAAELCDGLVNDCNAAALPTAEQDLDGDGYVQCTLSAGTWGGVIGGGDCNPVDDSVYPGAVELVDGIDNDCDTVLSADETDFDGDGYIPGVFGPSGWLGDPAVVGDQDCDDTVLERYPGLRTTIVRRSVTDVDMTAMRLSVLCLDGVLRPDRFRWQSASVQVIVDVLHGFYGVNGGNVTESDCVPVISIGDILHRCHHRRCWTDDL